MAQENGRTNLSFAERLAKAKREAEDKAKQQAESSVSSAKPIQKEPSANIHIYFHSSVDTFRFIVAPGHKANFKNHFYVTNDPIEIATIRKDFIGKISGHVRVEEVSEYFYQAARMIQPEILPLPTQEELTLEQQEQKLDNT